MVRIRKGLSQAQLALPELSDSYISLIESGKRMPTPDVLRLLARKLGCSTAYLLSGIDEATQDKIRMTLEDADAALSSGDAAAARDGYAELLAHPDLSGLPEAARRVKWGYALALEATGAIEGALRALEDLASELSLEFDTDEWVRLNIAVSRCHREKGDVARSVAVAEVAFARVTARPGPWSDETVKLGATLVGSYLERGDLFSARQLTDRLIERADAIGGPAARMAAYWEAADVAGHQADYETAVTYSEHALQLLGDAADQRNLSRLRGIHGKLMLLARPDDPGRARDELERAMGEMTASAASEIDLAHCLTDLARAEIAIGRPEQGAALAGRALDLLGEERRLATAGALIVLGRARTRLGDGAGADDALGLAMDCLQRMEPSREAAEGWFYLAELLGEIGTEQRQAEAYRKALTCAGI
jgi:transcriptional regulator with XRE-family HTH domain